MKDEKIILKKCPLCGEYMQFEAPGVLHFTNEPFELWECLCCYKKLMFRLKKNDQGIEIPFSYTGEYEELETEEFYNDVQDLLSVYHDYKKIKGD